jgi:hypothetical protein
VQAFLPRSRSFDYRIDQSICNARADQIRGVVCHVSTRDVLQPIGLTYIYSYFLFHAALVITLCIISFPYALEVEIWYEDVRLARSTFRDHLVEDSLSARCVAILDQVVSNQDTNAGLFQDLELDRDALSTFPWSVESNELFSSFDWNLNPGGL